MKLGKFGLVVRVGVRTFFDDNPYFDLFPKLSNFSATSTFLKAESLARLDDNIQIMFEHIWYAKIPHGDTKQIVVG